ncbi:Snf7 family [Paraphysoderma sedebokerense]|nr:Snf7 family [Paraphysoderma sedebokerense]
MNPLNLFKKETPKEQLRKQQRELKSVQRDLERDRLQLERQEKQIELEIKKAARAGNQTLCKQYAKQLIRIRKQKEKSFGASAQVSAIGHRATAMHSSVAISTAMAGASKAMAKSNSQISIEKLQNTMMEFEKQNMEMDMKEEMMNDTTDDVMDEQEDEEEGENILNQVLDEIGIEVGSKLADAPRTKLPEQTVEDQQIEARLKQLKNLQ